MAVTVFPADDPAVVAFFDKHGWALIDAFSADESDRLREWVDDVASWDETTTRCLHYREMTDDGPKLCRTENFVPFHEGLRTLLTQGRVVEIASLLLGEPGVLYKEKINYKLAGGAGYAPHQDAPAYPFIQTHISCMIAVDDSDASNGCLEAVSGRHHQLLPTDHVGCIPAELAA